MDYKKLARLLNTCLARQVPFVSYRIPGNDEVVTWVQSSGKMLFVESIVEVADKAGFVYAPFHRKTDFPVVFFEPEHVFIDDGFDAAFLSELENGSPLYPEYELAEPAETSREEYFQQAESLISALDSQLLKVVLSRVLTLNKPRGFDPGLMFGGLLQSYPEAFCHLINIPGAGCWAGASPEILLRKDEKWVQTVSLAGTQPYRKEKKPLWEAKEIDEQNLVSTHIEGVLEHCGITSYSREPVETIRAGQLLHLSSRFKIPANAFTNGFSTFLDEIHPTPAVCGIPAEKALDLILQTEKHNREYYSGYCGPLNFKGTSDLFVNLRCMKILPEKLAVFSGGGLTRGSQPRHEWEETEWKTKTLLSKI